MNNLVFVWFEKELKERSVQSKVSEEFSYSTSKNFKTGLRRDS